MSGNGSADNIDKLDLEDAQLGFVQNDVANYAYNGIRFEQYEGKPINSFTALCALYTETVQLVTCNPDIKSVEDLKGKNVSIGSAGSGVYFNAMDFLAAYDMTEADINPQYLSFGDSAESLKDGKIDAAFVVAGAPTPAVVDLATTKGCYLVGLDDAHVEKLQAISAHLPGHRRGHHHRRREGHHHRQRPGDRRRGLCHRVHHLRGQGRHHRGPCQGR